MQRSSTRAKKRLNDLEQTAAHEFEALLPDTVAIINRTSTNVLVGDHRHAVTLRVAGVLLGKSKQELTDCAAKLLTQQASDPTTCSSLAEETVSKLSESADFFMELGNLLSSASARLLVASAAAGLRESTAPLSAAAD